MQKPMMYGGAYTPGYRVRKETMYLAAEEPGLGRLLGQPEPEVGAKEVKNLGMTVIIATALGLFLWGKFLR